MVTLLGPLMDPNLDPRVTTTSHHGIVSVCIQSWLGTLSHARDEIGHTVALVERLLGPIVFGHGPRTLSQSLTVLLTKSSRTLATAESCTGGLVGKAITDVPGSSAVYVGGWVVYSNAMKTRQLDVSEALIQRYGAVSDRVARAMAHGALERSDADLAVSVTGVAGPEGGTTINPVGTVWVGLASAGHGVVGGVTTDAVRCRLEGDRACVRDLASKCALQLLRYMLLGVPLQNFNL